MSTRVSTVSSAYGLCFVVYKNRGDERSVGVVGDFIFQAEDGIRVVERSRGLGDRYKRRS